MDHSLDFIQSQWFEARQFVKIWHRKQFFFYFSNWWNSGWFSDIVTNDIFTILLSQFCLVLHFFNFLSSLLLITSKWQICELDYRVLGLIKNLLLAYRSILIQCSSHLLLYVCNRLSRSLSESWSMFFNFLQFTILLMGLGFEAKRLLKTAWWSHTQGYSGDVASQIVILPSDHPPDDQTVFWSPWTWSKSRNYLTWALPESLQ